MPLNNCEESPTDPRYMDTLLERLSIVSYVLVIVLNKRCVLNLFLLLSFE